MLSVHKEYQIGTRPFAACWDYFGPVRVILMNTRHLLFKVLEARKFKIKVPID